MTAEGIFPKVDGDIFYASEANKFNFNITPVGTVLSWLKSLTGTPVLPAQWVECNGQTISDVDSVYNGVTIPDLNGAIAFSGTATGGSQFTLVKTGAGWTVNAFVGKHLNLLTGSGTANGVQTRVIVSNTTDTITVDTAWHTAFPTGTTTFSVRNPQRFLRGGTTSGTTGGTPAHTHDVGTSLANNFQDTPYVRSFTPRDHIPPFYEIVWILRIK